VHKLRKHENLVYSFVEKSWHKQYKLFNNYYNQQENNERLVIIAGYVTLVNALREVAY